MKSLLLILTAALLYGCGGNVKTEVVQVQVPVPVPCVDQEDVPSEVEDAALVLRKDDSAGDKIKAVLIEREQLRRNDGIFRALIKGCITRE